MLKTISNILTGASCAILLLWFCLFILHPCVRCACFIVLAVGALAFANYARRGCK